jgi:pimeloyl-ACP methyl ester carboxylesterase
MLPVHVTTWDDAQERGDQVILVHGTMTWGLASFAEQRPLAAHRRILVIDRRGFGASPDTDQSDYEVDADDVVGLMDRPTHLVGHSYGGVVAMLAAAKRPERVRSLALIEPAALAVAAELPVVAAAVRANRRYVAATRTMSAESYLPSAFGAEAIPEPRHFALRAARTAMRERSCWEADLPVAALAAHDYPKVVLAGAWDTASADYRSRTGEALIATAQLIARRIGGRFHQIPRADHMPHQQNPDDVNRLLVDLWERADEATPNLGGARDDNPDHVGEPQVGEVQAELR